MALLTEFNKEMLIRSAYGSISGAIALAEKSMAVYQGNPHPICQSRYRSLKRIVRGLKWIDIVE